MVGVFFFLFKKAIVQNYLWHDSCFKKILQTSHFVDKLKIVLFKGLMGVMIHGLMGIIAFSL